MFLKYNLEVLLVLIFACSWSEGKSVRGTMLLYSPKDISTECATSEKLRFDVSYGMGSSDTITLVLRNMEIDYECQIDIVSEKYDTTGLMLIVVIKYPTEVIENCDRNPTAFIILKKNSCYVLCSMVDGDEAYTMYYAISSATRFRFHFTSNSRINGDMNALMYSVTATSARPKGTNESCHSKNETECVVGGQGYCFTSFVMCDGINNCGVDDWFDERKNQCAAHYQTMKYESVFSLALVGICACLTIFHIVRRCVPPVPTFFFIFNTNDENRFCVSPLLVCEHKDSYSIHGDNAPKNQTMISISSTETSEEDDEDETEPQPVPSETWPDDAVPKLAPTPRITEVVGADPLSMLIMISERGQSMLQDILESSSSHATAKPPPDLDDVDPNL